jgi:drug/metabolite transporter (DMT)-like permease
VTGIFYALAAAAMWAAATRIFKDMSDHWSAAALALIKSWVGLLLFIAWFLIADIPLFLENLDVIIWLVISGVVGIAIGDTALFLALYRMGERQTLLIAETAAPVIVLISAFILLSEQVAALQLTGILLVILGVDWVIGLRKGSGHFDGVGIAWATLAAVCQSFGVLVSRLFLTETEISAGETALWRILGACIALPVWLILRGESIRPSRHVNLRTGTRLFVAIFFGTVLGILFLQISIDLLPAGIAQTLIATSILFAVIFAALLGEKVDLRQWTGVAIALVGVAFISLRLQS